MTGNNSNKETTMNAAQKQIMKDATKIIRQLRKLDMHKAADELNRRVADMMDAAA